MSETEIFEITNVPATEVRDRVRDGALCRLSVPVEQAVSPEEDEETGDVTFWAVGVDKNRRANRRGFIFDWDKPEDVKLDNFLRNPVLLYVHDPLGDTRTLGRVEKIEVTGARVRLFCRIPGGPDYDDIKPIRVRVRDGYLKAVSIGFYVLRSEEVKDPKTEEVVALKIKSFELVELSVCPIGAHPTAIIGQQSESSGSSVTRGLLAAFACPAGSRWEASELYDPEHGGVAGRLFRLALENKAVGQATEQPYPNEHACRLRDPGEFKRGSFRRTKRKHGDREYTVILGRLKDSDKMTEQAYRYAKDVWPAADARAHCKDHGGKFEPARKGQAELPEEDDGCDTTPKLSEEGLSSPRGSESSLPALAPAPHEEHEKQARYQCECIRCGHKLETDRHCRDLKCPKCGGQMRRAERPGPGQAAETQEGRVLSKKNRMLIQNAVDTSEKAIAALRVLLAEADKGKGSQAASPPPVSTEKEKEQEQEIPSAASEESATGNCQMPLAELLSQIEPLMRTVITRVLAEHPGFRKFREARASAEIEAMRRRNKRRYNLG